MSNSEVNKGSASPEKKGDKSLIIELKNGKVVCRQKSVSFEKQSETLQEIVKFREFIEERLGNSDSPLTALPEEYRSLIAKLAHESDKTLVTLAKHIRQELLPVQDEEDATRTANANAMLPLSVVEAAINSTMDRNNYGIDVPLGVKLPASLAVWRWEVKEQFWECLPKNGREKADTRLEERKAAKKALGVVFEQLTQAEKDVLLKTKGVKLPAKDANADTRTPEPTDAVEPPTESAKKLGKKKATADVADDENGTTLTPKAASKQPKPVDSEKAARDKERLEKKAAKEEKERKALDAQKKSRSLMANFFSKPKVTIGGPRPKAQSPSVSGPSTSQSDFERVFKPFMPKRDSVVAPVNWFKQPREGRVKVSDNREVIVIDDEDTAGKSTTSEPQTSETELSQMRERERLNSILSRLPAPLDSSRLPHRRTPTTRHRVYHPCPVRDTMNQVSEAEIAGDDNVVRSLLSKLQDRAQYPAKALIFREDARPGYYGTWTRTSRVIGPRRPLARDLLVFDYGYDSGEEWEEEPVGEDVAEGDDDEDETEADADSDADSWLVDDDEDVDVNLNDLESISPPDLFEPLAPVLPSAPKRKADEDKKEGLKKRKVIVPLVPFAKGPCWEERVGECSYEPFNAYRMQLFNDTPFPIDPFTYVSTCIEDQRASHRAATNTTVPATTTNDGFAVPPVPSRLASTTTNTSASSTSTLPLNLPPSSTHPSLPSALSSGAPGPSALPPLAAKKAYTPKTPFPDAHLPFLLAKIAEMDTSSLVLLVETVYEALRPNKVTKASVEAKIREVGEKDKAKKKWVVKPAFAGLVAPVH